jgi:hypothetical protein
MDPITLGLSAFAAAQAAVKGVQACIKLGKDISEISSELGSFFKSSAQVEKSIEEVQQKINTSDETDQELVARVLDLKIKEKKLKDDHNALKDMIIYELGEPSLWFDTMKMVDAIKLQRQKEKTKDALIEQERIHTAIDLKRKKDREESQKRRNRDQLLEIINKVVIWTIAILIGGATTIGLFYYMLGKASALVIRNLGV